MSLFLFVITVDAHHAHVAYQSGPSRASRMSYRIACTIAERADIIPTADKFMGWSKAVARRVFWASPQRYFR